MAPVRVFRDIQNRQKTRPPELHRNQRTGLPEGKSPMNAALLVAGGGVVWLAVGLVVGIAVGRAAAAREKAATPRPGLHLVKAS